MKVSISTVYFNSKSIEQTAESVFAGKISGDFEYIIVDNNSADKGALEQSMRRFPQIQRVQNQTNAGFAAANNLALRQAKGDYFVFLNPDIILERETLNTLIVIMEKSPDIGCISSRILDVDGNTLASCRRFPKFATMISRFVPFFPHAAEYLASYEMADVNRDQPMDVDWLSGGFLVTRTALLRKIGGMDERYFLYFEDVDVCRTIKQTSRVVYYPLVSCRHLTEHRSRRDLKLFSLHVTSCLKYFSKWGFNAQ